MRGLKPPNFMGALRGAEAPLFYGAACRDAEALFRGQASKLRIFLRRKRIESKVEVF